MQGILMIKKSENPLIASLFPEKVITLEANMYATGIILVVPFLQKEPALKVSIYLIVTMSLPE